MIHQPGSIKNNIVNSDLLNERKNLDFEQQEMRVFLHGGEDVYQAKMYYHNIFSKHPELANHHKFYEMSRHEKQMDLWTRVRFVQTHYPEIFINSHVNKYPYIFWQNWF